jgi:Protein of unknown function (DUF2934)
MCVPGIPLLLLLDEQGPFWSEVMDRTLKRKKELGSFDSPQEPEWHHMIAEAAYFIAEKRGFVGEHSLDDWLAAEQQIKHIIAP